MKLFENISNGYKRIATGIAIIGFLTIMYIALIPAGSVAQVYGALSGTPIIGATVKIAEWPQYNTTTDETGAYTLNNVPYDNNTGSTYTLRISAPGYGSNSSPVTLTAADPIPAVSMDLYTSDPTYIPYLDHRGIGSESSIQVFNPYDFNTTADITEYNVLNGLNTTMAFEVPVNWSNSKYAYEVAGGVNFVGTAKVENTRPQSLVQGLYLRKTRSIYSIAPSRKLSTSTVQYLPYLDDRGTGTDSGIQIFNPYGFNITANLIGYNALAGNTATNLSFEIPAKSFGSRYAGEVAGGAQGANINFVGTVVIETFNSSDYVPIPALVQGSVRRIVNGTISLAPAISLSNSTVQYLPYLDDRGAGTDSGIQIFNPYDFNITANLTGYNALNNNLETKLTFEIPAKTYGSRYAGEVAGGAQGANVNFVGTVVVETFKASDNTPIPALVQGSLRRLIGLDAGTISLAPAILMPDSTDQYILFMNDTGTVYDSGIQVFNPYDVNITVDMTGYNLLNSLTTTLSFEISPKTYGSKYAGEVAGGAQGANVNFVGSMKVHTSQPAPVQASIRKLLSSTTTLAPATVVK